MSRARCSSHRTERRSRWLETRYGGDHALEQRNCCRALSDAIHRDRQGRRHLRIPRIETQRVTQKPLGVRRPPNP
jgi:hypothetical protein